MLLIEWEKLPISIKNPIVKTYYDNLSKKILSLVLKRMFDVIFSLILMFILTPLIFLLCVLIKLDSNGPIFFHQVRVTQFGKLFKVLKFRSMIVDAEKLGSQITGYNDTRITRIGRFLRKYRLDELPQLINILVGDMTFVGTRPEVVKYVDHYTDEMKATLLLPAGVTSEASIIFNDEEILLRGSKDIDYTYINMVLPQKMKINLSNLKNFSFVNDIKTLIKTITVFL